LLIVPSGTEFTVAEQTLRAALDGQHSIVNVSGGNLVELEQQRCWRSDSPPATTCTPAIFRWARPAPTSG
jgi:hypothetical protein